ncbi:branched-chain amino acid transport system substrate-binding protein [Mesorhizobium sp. J18]|uniref:branched-chain amino acid ABC transporter substrate-binding protein n=1 Tax=Mesorhizobium sp. J18 TaxID=935263 RepID=UPI00119A894D|nr:branched-chain amino acid ABC transporter substrate-binding protein [Mesorhizobium sp. J18]TWG98494.1 branched-chain amino acid transport system substrate-binding protein [Mesorhizobium sp. J18]
MRLASLFLFMAAGFASGAAHALEMRIGLSAPLTETAERLGQQLRQGAEAAASAIGQHDVSLAVADDRCSAEAGAAAARQFVEQRVSVVIGFLCTESIEAALPILKDAGIPVITPGVRTNSLTDNRERTGWPVYRLAPRADQEEKAVAEIVIDRWRNQHFAIIDDGTIYGRNLAENLRAAAELQGLKPVFIDTYRPQLDNQIGLVGRLRRAGATHVFVGGDRSDIAIIARDAASLDYELAIAGGEALRAEGNSVPLARGVLMIGLPLPAEIASEDALQALEAANIVPDGYAIPGYAALQVAVAALEQAETENRPVAEILSSSEFETALGPVNFDEKGDPAQNPYRLFRFDGAEFMEVQ